MLRVTYESKATIAKPAPFALTVDAMVGAIAAAASGSNDYLRRAYG
jgi:hypothetical protein